MRARDLFIGSFQMINAYRRTFILLAIPLFIISILFNLASNSYQRASIEAMTNPLNYNPLANAGIMFIGLFVILFFGLILAVAWHRRSLLDEVFSYQPDKIFNGHIWSYFVGLLIIMLIYIGVFILAGFAFSLFVGLSISTGSAGVIGVFSFIAGIAAIAFMLWFVQFMTRVSIILPSRAVGKPVSIREALQATKGQHWMLIRFLLITIIISFIAYAPIIIDAVQNQFMILQMFQEGLMSYEEAMQLSIASPVEIAYSSFVGVIATFFQIGVLTILYAHFIKVDVENILG